MMDWYPINTAPRTRYILVVSDVTRDSRRIAKDVGKRKRIWRQRRGGLDIAPTHWTEIPYFPGDGKAGRLEPL